MQVKAHLSRIASSTIQSVHIDKGTVDFYMRLTSYYSQFRAVGSNYNQIVKLLYRSFSEKKAAAFFYKLEKQTAEMVVLFKKVVDITEEFDRNYLKQQ